MTVEQKLILMDKLMQQYKQYGSTPIHDCFVAVANQLLAEKIELPKDLKI